MKIDFSQLVKIEGETVKLTEDRAASLGSAVRLALNTMPDTQGMTVEDIVRRGRLSLRVASEGIQDVTPEEVAQMRGSLNVFSRPELVAVIYDMLDPINSDHIS